MSEQNVLPILKVDVEIFHRLVNLLESVGGPTRKSQRGNMNMWTNHPTLVEIFQSGPTETIVPTPLPSLKTRSRATFQNSSTWDIILTKTTTELHDFPALFSRTQAPGGTSDHKLPPCVRKQEKQAWTRLCLHAHPVPAQRSSFIQDELWGEVQMKLV